MCKRVQMRRRLKLKKKISNFSAPTHLVHKGTIASTFENLLPLRFSLGRLRGVVSALIHFWEFSAFSSTRMSLLHPGLIIISHVKILFLLLRTCCLFVHVYDILIVLVPDEREQFRDCRGGVRGWKHQEVRQPVVVLYFIGKYYLHGKPTLTDEGIRRCASL